MEQDLEAPCFEKTMTHTMLHENERVMTPVSFIRSHGHMLDTVISLTGAYGETYAVPIKTYPPVRGRGQTEIRFFLRPGWKEFRKENGFQVGHCVLFRLVGNSCFHVLVSSKLQENILSKTPRLSKCFKERGLGKSGREDDGTIPRTKVARLRHPKVKSRDQATNVKEEAVMKHPQLPETDYAKHLGLDVAINTNSRFPQFIRKLSRSNLCSHDTWLEVPLRFAKEYEHKFQGRVCLLGPNGQWRIVKIRISSTLSTTTRTKLVQESSIITLQIFWCSGANFVGDSDFEQNFVGRVRAAFCALQA